MLAASLAVGGSDAVSVIDCSARPVAHSGWPFGASRPVRPFPLTLASWMRRLVSLRALVQFFALSRMLVLPLAPLVLWGLLDPWALVVPRLVSEPYLRVLGWFWFSFD